MLEILAGIFITAAVGLAVRSSYERKRFKTEHFYFNSEKLKEGTDLKAVFLSDLHNNEFGSGNEELIKAIRREEPDFILIGGDMMVCKGEKGIDIPFELIRKLSERYPVYYGNGNHEVRMRKQVSVYGDQYTRYVESLRKLGVVYLEDQSAEVEFQGQKLTISSVDLEKKYYKKLVTGRMEASYLQEKLGYADKGAYQITMIHSPEYIRAAHIWGSDLVLSGHFHGGTIRLPFLGALMSPQFQLFPRYSAGEYQEGGTKMIVSRGLGTHSINIRLNNFPQLAVLHFKGTGK